MDGAQQPAAAPAISATERAAQRMIRSAAAIWAWAGLPGERFDELLAEGREAYRAETIIIEQRRRGG